MNEKPRSGRTEKAQLRRPARAELVWEGKYDDAGRRVAPLRVALPFQTVETVNESAQDRQRSLLLGPGFREEEWRNRLIWGDKKYVKLPSQFAALAPKVREFLENKAFGERVALDEPAMIKAISSNVAQYVTVKSFVDELRKLVISELEPQLLHAGRFLSETPPFPWSRPTLEASKSVFNLVPCDNAFEKEFAQFLEKAADVQRFAKLPDQFGFAIEYTDNAGNLRYYEPDFVALATDGTYYIVETKGLEDTNVANKDRAAQLWCENTTKLTGKPWAYFKVLQSDYNKLQPTTFEDLLVLVPKQLF